MKIRIDHLRITLQLIHLGMCVSAVKYSQISGEQFSTAALRDMFNSSDHYARTYALLVLYGLVPVGEVVLDRTDGRYFSEL